MGVQGSASPWTSVTYAIMGNHFHLLVRVPNRDKFLARFQGEGGEEKRLRHLSLRYSAQYLRSIKQELSERVVFRTLWPLAAGASWMRY